MKRPEDTIFRADGIMYVPQTSVYTAEPTENPWEWEKWGPPTYTELFVGLRPGIRPVDGGFEVIPDDELADVEPLDEDDVIEELHRKFPAASIVRQVGKERGKPAEPSLRVIVYHDPSEESLEEFDSRIEEAVEELVEDLAQESILVHKVVEGKDEGTLALSWSGE